MVPRIGKLKGDEPRTIKASELAKSAVSAFSHRICSKLLFNPMIKIDDAIPKVLLYVDAALTFIANLVKRKAMVPFQFDVAIG